VTDVPLVEYLRLKSHNTLSNVNPESGISDSKQAFIMNEGQM
jgi:hypothetical protein